MHITCRILYIYKSHSFRWLLFWAFLPHLSQKSSQMAQQVRTCLFHLRYTVSAFQLTENKLKMCKDCGKSLQSE